MRYIYKLKEMEINQLMFNDKVCTQLEVVLCAA
jgi:hypothetical protein